MKTKISPEVMRAARRLYDMVESEEVQYDMAFGRVAHIFGMGTALAAREVTKDMLEESEEGPIDPNAALIEQLSEIKKSIIRNATDVLFMVGSNTTVCEQIDGMLSELGVDNDTLENQYIDFQGKAD